MRVYNFSAGPSAMPDIVLERIKSQIPEHGISGMSVMEMSHRSKEFLSIADEAESLLRSLMNIHENYKVLFLQGGATGQFSAIPLNLTKRTDTVDYVVTGMWGNKAFKEAQKYIDNVSVAAKPDEYNTVPDFKDWSLSKDAKYLHITPNETVHGVAFNNIPSVDVPLIGDISSIICAEPIDVSKFGVLYAGAQKNLGPAGLAIVIVREDLLGEARSNVPTIWDWQGKSNAQSMLNTPPTFSWYVMSEVLRWLKNDIGGLEAMHKINTRKASNLYDYIDESDFYSNPIDKQFRSIMNVPFLLANVEMDKKFIHEAKEAGMVNLAGHRAVGGMRASIYNGMPEEGVNALIQFMKEFEKNNG